MHARIRAPRDPTPWPHPLTAPRDRTRSYEPEIKFQLVGCIIGMAIYNDVKIDVSFPATMYSKLLGTEPTLDDLELLDPALAAGLRELLAVPSAEVSEYAADLCIDFEVTSEDPFGVRRSVALLKCGDVVKRRAADPADPKEGRPGAAFAPGALVRFARGATAAEEVSDVKLLLFTATFYANHAHNLTRSP